VSVVKQGAPVISAVQLAMSDQAPTTTAMRDRGVIVYSFDEPT